MRTRALFMCTLMLLSLWVPVSVGTSDGGDGDRGIEPLDQAPAWSDSFDDLSHVFVPTGGLVGVEVSGGSVRLLPGHDEGWIASSVIKCPADNRYDLVLLEADLPGESYVNVSILNASKAPSVPGFANETVPGFVNRTAADVSVFRVNPVAFPAIRIQVNLVAVGTDRPTLSSWSLMFIGLGEWRDDFLGTGKMESFSGLNLTAGTLELDLSGSGGGGGYDPYPPVVLPSSRGDVDVFYPTAAGDGYEDNDNIANSANTRGVDTDDLDADGFMDLILVRFDDSTDVDSYILWGSSSGEWSMSDSTGLSAQNTPEDATTGDVDGDGDIDVVITCTGALVGSTHVYLNQGGGTFGSSPSINITLGGPALDAGDVNNDGYDDIVVVLSGLIPATVVCYYGGDGGPDTTVDLTFAGGGTTNQGVNEVLLEDIDGDGYLDLLLATVNNNKEAPIYMGSDSGMDNTADYDLLLKDAPMDVAVGDVDGDGHMDIGYTTGSSAGTGVNVEVFKGQSSGWDKDHKHTISAGAGLRPLDLVDVDGDGYEDIVTGEQATLKIYMGGPSWPTAADVSKTGLDSPGDMAVAVPKDGGGGLPTGGLVTEAIPMPAGMRWDILYLDADVPPGTEVLVTVLDPNMDPIEGLGKLPLTSIDLSLIENWRSIHVRLDVRSESNATTPVLRQLLVNWVDRFTWRDQFYGDAKIASAMGLDVAGLRLVGAPVASDGPDLLFTSLRGDGGYNTRSIAFLESPGLDYTSRTPIMFETQGASAATTGDVDGDGVPDLVFSSYGKAFGSYITTSPLFLGSVVGWYEVPHHGFPTEAASDVALEDVDGDGHTDVVFAQDWGDQVTRVGSTLFWGSADGWADIPDVELATTAATGVEVVDVDGDGRLDLVFSCHGTNSMVFLQSASGFCETEPSHTLATEVAEAVASGDLDGDGRVDLVFANSFNGTSYEVDSFVYMAKAGGGFASTPIRLATKGANDVECEDLDGDGHLDLVFANSRNATSGYLSESYVFLNDGSGGFGPDPDARLATDGAVGVTVADLDGTGRKDLVFACRNNGTTYSIPSVVYLGGASGWSATPDIELPTTGATDALAMRLADPDRGGLLTQAITPDPDDDIGAFHTLRYTATLGGSQSGTVWLLDAETGERLASRALAAGQQEWDIREALSYRDHPSIRVLVSVRGLGQAGFSLDDLWLNWTKRVPMAPRVLEAGLTETSVYRTQSVHVVINVTDEFDAPETLKVLVQHRLDGQGEWRVDLLGTPTFSEGLWSVKVTPDRFAELGIYDLRINVTDSDGLYTGFLELEDALEVLPNLPGAPMLLSAVAGDGAVTLSWRAPRETGDVPLMGYRVHRGPSEGDLSPHGTTDPFTLTYADKTVTNGQTYHYAIQALSDLGDGPLSEVLNATPMGVPGQPLDLSAEAGDGMVTLTWGAPLLDGGSPVLGYRVYRGPPGGHMEQVAEVDGRSYEDTGLQNAETYSYRVSAFNAVGEGLTSEMASAMPMGLPDPPTDLVVEVGPGRLTLRWKAPEQTGGGVLTAFIIHRGTAADALETYLQLDGDSTSYVDALVEVGRTYHYAVAAGTNAGEGPTSGVVSAKAVDLPGLPEDLTATPGDMQVTLGWSPPSDDGASAVTGYVVLRGTSHLDLKEVAELGQETTYVDTSVVNGLTYHYAVMAINALGRGTSTEAVSATPAVPVFPPGAPLSVVGKAKGAKVILTWGAPASDGGMPVTGYVVLRGESADNLTVVAELGNVLTYTDEGLTRGTTYYYTVAAVNDVGQGEPFAAFEVKVPKKKADEPGFLALGAVATLALAAVLADRGRKRRR